MQSSDHHEVDLDLVFAHGRAHPFYGLGSGRKKSTATERQAFHFVMACDDQQCKPQACAIQNCLQLHNYDESKCTKIIDQLYECCSKFYIANGNSAKSVCCPRFDLLRVKIKQRAASLIDAKLL